MAAVSAGGSQAASSSHVANAAFITAIAIITLVENLKGENFHCSFTPCLALFKAVNLKLQHKYIDADWLRSTTF